MRKVSSILFSVFVALFVAGLVWGQMGFFICFREYPNYSELQQESFAPDLIETVLQDEEQKLIYVCYNTANCVNVYSESGVFLWAVGTPDLRNSCFELQDGKLIIYDGEAYIYDSANGMFIGVDHEDNMDLNNNWEEHLTSQFEEGEVYFDDYQVYKADAGGKLQVIVSRPWWHRLFNFGFGLSIAFVGAVGIGIVVFAEKKKDYNAVKEVIFKCKKAKMMKTYFMVTSIGHLTYTVLNIIFGFFGGWLIIGIIPLTVHMIMSNIIFVNMKDRLQCGKDEMEVVEYWGTCEWGSFIIAFLSVIVATGMVG